MIDVTWWTLGAIGFAGEVAVAALVAAFGLVATRHWTRRYRARPSASETRDLTVAHSR
jgi:hypothetical protein